MIWHQQHDRRLMVAQQCKCNHSKSLRDVSRSPNTTRIHYLCIWNLGSCEQCITEQFINHTEQKGILLRKGVQTQSRKNQMLRLEHIFSLFEKNSTPHITEDYLTAKASLQVIGWWRICYYNLYFVQKTPRLCKKRD